MVIGIVIAVVAVAVISYGIYKSKTSKVVLDQASAAAAITPPAKISNPYQAFEDQGKAALAAAEEAAAAKLKKIV